METDVLFALTGDIRCNSRALKQLLLLAEEGYRVLAVGLGTPAVSEIIAGVTLHTLERPAGGGPPFFWKCHQQLLQFLREHRARVYHASDLYTLPALAGAAGRDSGKLVFDARERYPYVASTAGRPWVRWFWEMVEARFIKKADVVFTVSQSIASHISASYNIELPEVLYNVPAYQEKITSDVLRQDLRLPPDAVIVLHQGNMQKDRGCLLLVRAMKYVKGAVLVFMGSGTLAPAVKAEAKALELEDRVLFKSAVPPDQLLQYTCSADIGVTLLEDTCLNHRYALPNKLFEYLMAGLPVLGSDLPEVGGIIEEYEVGCVVYPEDPKEIGRVLQHMVDHPELRKKWSAAGPEVFETFNWDGASQVFKQRYQLLFAS